MKVRSARVFHEPFILLSAPYSEGCFGLTVQNAGSDPIDALRVDFGIAPSATPVSSLRFDDLPFSDAWEHPLEQVTDVVEDDFAVLQPREAPSPTDQSLEILVDTILLSYGGTARFPDSIRAEAGLLLQQRRGSDVTSHGERWQRLGKAMGFGDPDGGADPGYELAALLYGTVRYTYRGAEHAVRFAKKIREEGFCQIGGAPEGDAQFDYNALLSPELRPGAEVRVPMVHRIDAHEMVRIALLVASPESATYDFDVYVDLEDGRAVRGGRVSLGYFFPRTMGTYFHLVEDQGARYLRVFLPGS